MLRSLFVSHRRLFSSTPMASMSSSTSGFSLDPARTPVIVSAVRTPVGSFLGSLAALKATALGATAIRGAVKAAGIDPATVEEVFMGNVVSTGVGQAPARQAVLGAGLLNTVEATTINKVCASGMKAIILAAQSIALGHRDVMVAGGMESMSNIPYFLAKARTGFTMGHQQLIDTAIHDGLWDVYNDVHMGVAAEKCAAKYGFTREQQDAYALESYRRASAAHKAGLYAAEIVPVEVTNKKGETTLITDDEEYHKLDASKVPKLRPAFQKDGTVTAANSSKLNDGASAVVIMSQERAEKLGIPWLAKIVSFGEAAHDPLEFTTAPSLAVPIALKRLGLSSVDVDLWELNEAFSVVALANMQLLEIPQNKININGGAVALGHPIGSSGCRIVVSLIHQLRQQNKRRGVAAICNGGGAASALVLEA